MQESIISSLMSKFKGISGGEENGIRGYFLTYMIAYLRDVGLNHHFVAESFETSVPWSKVSTLCEKVGDRLVKAAVKRGIDDNKVLSSFRITQIYETGAAVYVYFGL